MTVLTTKEISIETKIRIANLMLKGWGIRYFKKSSVIGSRHSVWISIPGRDEWYAEKIDVTDENLINDNLWINGLLDNIGN